VDGDEASDKAAQNYEKHLSETLQNAAQNLFAMVAALQHQTHVETHPAERLRSSEHIAPSNSRMTPRAKPGPLSERPI
jgi:hypothetical protein